MKLRDIDMPEPTPPAQQDPDTVMRTEISGPGIYDDMPHHVYHADPTPAADGGSLSHTGAMHLLPPKTPAHFAHWRLCGQAPKREFDFGHALHTAVLGVGLQVRVVEADSWRTKAAKTEAAEARAAGEVPLLAKEAETINPMLEQVRAHPLAGPLLDPERGVAERSFFWRHPRTGKWCRTRPDFCPHSGARRFMLVDYKTADHADPEAFGRAAASYGYHIQRAMALAAVRALGLHPDPEMVFVVQEKTPPYLVAVHFLDDKACRVGERKFEQAANLFARCTDADSWPGYGDKPLLSSLPGWTVIGEDLA